MRETSPPRTATEALLNTSAADRAASRLNLSFPQGTKVFVDAANFDGLDAKYAIGAIRERLAKLGAHLVPAAAKADMIVEIRAGALSLDESQFLIGVPQFGAPIPFAGTVNLPEIPLYREHRRKGVTRIAATVLHAKDGSFVAAARSRGNSHRTDYTVLLFISWTTTDVP
ncbi:MAG: hypothetical protein KIT16_04540 [Rhodospirillaceae bacterium]|nr:hypothetical protein [Rhodospirillaceae bacterium]